MKVKEELEFSKTKQNDVHGNIIRSRRKERNNNKNFKNKCNESKEKQFYQKWKYLKKSAPHKTKVHPPTYI